jgi:lipopolysaccharide export system protein LptA
VTLTGLLALAALAQQPAAGAPATRPASAAAATAAPVRVDADKVHYAFQKREVTFTGAPVVLTRDDARLTCRELLARTDAAGQVQVATCQGDVKLTRADRVLTCLKAVFEAGPDRVTCEGDAVLREGGSEARGARLVYDLGADEVRFEGTPGKPVQILVPGAELDERQQELERRRKEARR